MAGKVDDMAVHMAHRVTCALAVRILVRKDFDRRPSDRLSDNLCCISASVSSNSRCRSAYHRQPSCRVHRAPQTSQIWTSEWCCSPAYACKARNQRSDMGERFRRRCPPKQTSDKGDALSNNDKAAVARRMRSDILTTSLQFRRLCRNRRPTTTTTRRRTCAADAVEHSHRPLQLHRLFPMHSPSRTKTDSVEESHSHHYDVLDRVECHRHHPSQLDTHVHQSSRKNLRLLNFPVASSSSSSVLG